MLNLLVLGLLYALPIAAPQDQGPYFASGIKAGDVDQSSAVVWVRLSQKPTADFSKLPILSQGLTGKQQDVGVMPIDVVPGMDGEVRIQYWESSADPSTTQRGAWQPVTSASNFVHQFQLTDLQPKTTYVYLAETRRIGSSGISATMRGKFQTAPAATDAAVIRFAVTTCQAVRSIDAGTAGHRAYQQMLAFEPQFLVHTGDIVYYDKAPLAKTPAQALAKWDLMFAYKHNQDFHRQVSTYFMKDDHDTLKNDCWPGQSYGELTFAQGLAIFRQQVPIREQTYRSVRWGKDVQIWMTENRDFRSSNRMKDGPQKTILGATQMAWLKQSLAESNATYKFILSPGPIVGPDKKGKSDNHANSAFFHEGQALRDFLSKLPNTYVICGDRHWQYCSTDPKTGLIEMGCGPINDQHNFGGNPGNDEKFHSYFSEKGGFLGITVNGKSAVAEWFSADSLVPRHRLMFTAEHE